MAAMLGTVAVFLIGCQSVGYYAQAVQGQCSIWRKAESVERVMRSADTPPDLKAQLRLALELRSFAADELRLPVGEHYLEYADLGQKYVVWNVYAAPEYWLDPREWWYPFAGALKYRGYFSEERALAYAQELAAEGYDVYTGGVEAYSTLGWFNDPLLNTFIHHEEVVLAEILFHELAHHRLFVKGDTDFSEAFATAVAEQGVLSWLERTGDPAVQQEYAKRLERHREWVDLIMRFRERLKEFYANAEDLPSIVKAAKKQEMFETLRSEHAALKRQWNGFSRYDPWFNRPLNNAHLNTVSAYYRLVPAFRAMFEAHGRDWEEFYAAVEELGRLPMPERHQRLLRTIF